ncbi:MAG: hypothetical protein N2504_05415 [candidate division WOR-3 bacterium]|nr:hypothetical protein [candidate division WOR-3 bacterium]MCX7948008.1 hypothetical protein [candidate division WOR-3 bacterium]MDW8151094.1 hypothetical protein [candidate division WOR-3 bacterium]
MEVIGIDENGLGPILGPFIISGIKVKVNEPIFFNSKLENLRTKIKIDDSKEIFKRSEMWTYSKGEIISLSILKAFTFTEIIEKYVKLLITDFEKNFYIQNYKLPIWAKYISEDIDIGEKINFINYRAFAVFPKIFNNMLKDMHKFQLGIKLFIELAKELSNSDYNVVMCGKVGGYTYYLKPFSLIGVKTYEIIKETRGHSAYRIFYMNKTFEFHFLMDGDKVYYPIAVASIIGKYLREIFMKSLNERFGLYDKIPYSSGYKHDYKTATLIEKIQTMYKLEDFVRIK